MKIDILGTKYTICEKSRKEEPFLNECDGFCDKTSKRIVVVKESEDSQLDDWNVYRNKVMRHEIIHAFMFESGLHENFKHDEWGHDETTIDWFACQFPKLLRAFEKAKCL